MLGELYLWEVFAGKPEIKFKGIYPLIDEYLADRKYGQATVEKVRMHLSFLLARAKGEVKTGARLQRDFVTSHPEYKRDSVVSPTIAYELVESVLAYSSSKQIEEKMEHMGC